MAGTLAEDIQKHKDKKKGKPVPAEVKQVYIDAEEEITLKLPSPGLKVGDTAPDFTLQDAFGKKVSLSEELKKGPVVVTFYRGSWCPYCNLQLRAYQKNIKQFQKYGATLIAITPQQPDRSKDQLKKTPLDFEIVSDLDSKVAKDYKLFFKVPEALSKLYKERYDIDLEYFNGKDRKELPVPGTFIIDRNGVIQSAFAKVDYTARMEPQAIIDALANL